MRNPDRRSYWLDAFTLRGSVTPHVASVVVTFGILSMGICSLSWLAENTIGHRLALQDAPYEIAGAVLGLLLVFRTNAGYDRWWEARKLWGGIVNQSRNLAISGLTYGPTDADWRRRFIAWTAAFPHVARNSLRGDSVPAEVNLLLGPQNARQLEECEHMPSLVSLRIALLLREANERHQMDRFSFLRVDHERAELINHIGACERILRTPLPRVYAIKVRQFITLFLLTLPLSLLHRLETDWLIPLITMVVAYPLVALDQISVELQNPFNNLNLNHLPLDDIAAMIERNVTSLSNYSDPENAEVIDFRPVLHESA
ncbi:Bestrophin, RFP-TM, chloride channel [Caulifigura coniformis]|uniref:Bestrophin, RFP-TM, chloride channel n=1 Tax=Caulifigura coniformis TaxID=2527983 RepID=A0A517SMI6_9PLAN|nr:bestrophin family ion channel [Caulifigura coniformis]QDT57341.1 Bestrophin, RFP-TM, chloride channel [Caulifigura coniformis]